MSKLARFARGEVRSAGFPRPDKPFRAHLTLGRVRRGYKLSWDEVLGAAGGLTLDNPPFIIRSMRLFQSELRPQGPRYTALVTAPSREGDSTLKGD